MLRTRLYVGLLPLVLLIIATGGYAIYVCNDLAGSLSRDLVANYRAIVACQQMRTSATLMTSALSPPQLSDADRKTFEDHRSAFHRELMAQSQASAGKPRARLVAALDAAFQELSEEGTRQIRAGGAATMADMQSRNAALIRVLQAIEKLTQRDFEAAKQAAARVETLSTGTRSVMLITIAGGVVLSLVLAWRLAESLLEPIRLMTASAIALGDGNLDRDVPEVSRDELGQLAKAFNTMAAKLRAYRDATLARVLRAQRTMEATLTSVPDPVFVVGRDGTQEVRNPAAEELSKLREFAHGFPSELADAVARVLRTGEHYVPTDYSRTVTLRVGREDRHFVPRILAVGDKLTEFKGAAIILQDVTKLRLLDDAKTNLVGTVSHELKTPLTSLRMALYLLLEQNLSALTQQQRELLEDPRNDADRLLRILDTLLDITRLESGASSLERTNVGVSALMRQVAGEAHPIMDNAGQRLAVVIAPELNGAEFNVDESRIRHVFINLLTNASKFTPSGGFITLSAAPEGPGFIRFSVRDQGPGIPPESVGRIFDRFYRAPNQAKRSGAGLGLAIAREIVVAHGGSIACVNSEGEGAEFYFVLPR